MDLPIFYNPEKTDEDNIPCLDLPLAFEEAVENPEMATTLMLASMQGEWKQHPVAGANLRSYLNAPLSGNDTNVLQRHLQIQLDLAQVNGTININNQGEISVAIQ